ncbi:MAG: ATP-binding protein [Proteobacteria bacterium]|nr:ATP-binding protein [Pseudomonadota bacterium]
MLERCFYAGSRDSSGDCVISVQDVLNQKGERLISVAPQAPVAEIARLLSAEQIGTVLVIGENGLEGIISERDLISAFSRFGGASVDKRAADVMTAIVITCLATADLASVLALMSLHTIRHVPVVHDGKVIGLVSIRDILDFQQQLLVADISRREEDAKALREAHAKLEAAFQIRTEEFRMARDIAVDANNAKTVFLANISHELRTPLNAIIGFSDVMGTEIFGPVGCKQYQDYVGNIHDAGLLLLSLINDLLHMAKIDAGKEELSEQQVNIAETVNSALNMLSDPAIKSNISISHDVEAGIPLMWADQRKLHQVLTNLLSNAVKFTEQGGRVSLKVWWRSDSGFVFQVADTGIGIARGDIPKALSQFGQVDSALNRKFDGSGLGLPLAKTFVELHGGSLDLQSEPGVGTTVTVRFPASRIFANDNDEKIA